MKNVLLFWLVNYYVWMWKDVLDRTQSNVFKTLTEEYELDMLDISSSSN